MQDAEGLAGEDSIDDGGERGIAVPDHEAEARHTVAEIHQEIPRLLGDPGAAEVGRDAQEMNAAGGVLHHEQYVKPVQQQGVDAEEVGGEDAVCLGSQELAPGGAAAAWGGVDAARLRINHTVLGASG